MLRVNGDSPAIVVFEEVGFNHTKEHTGILAIARGMLVFICSKI